MNLNRLIISVVVGLTLSTGAIGRAQSTPSSPKPPRRPNIICIYTDDQRWDALGVVQREMGSAARFPWLRSPNMDRLAAQGVRFRNAFVVDSLCSPSRACILTGQYNLHNGVRDNATEFPLNNVTLASILRQSGYVTGFFGKWHMDDQKGPRPGFDVSISFIGHGRYMNCPFEINGVPTPTHGWVDDVTTDYAIRFMREHRTQPFLAVIGMKTPHDNRTPKAEHTNLYKDAKYIPPVNATARPPFGQDQSKSVPQAGELLDSYTLQYFQTLAGADDDLGRLMAALDELGIAQDTVVLYLSDNGYYMREHGLSDKRTAYEESMRIPMLLRYPRLNLAGKVLNQMVLNVDIAPTLLSLAGVKVPSTMQGRSWLPLLQNNFEGWRTAFYYEYFVDSQFPNIKPVQAVRTDTAKLIRYPGHEKWTELFDLKKDPYEMHNLIKEPASADLLKEMTAEFERQQALVKELKH